MTAGKSPLKSVIDRDSKCRGFTLRRRPGEVESYTADEISIGLFPDQPAAVDAVLSTPRGGTVHSKEK